MQLVRFKLRPTSPWQTPWQADTLAGMLCWTMARHKDFGPADLKEKILSPALGGKPPFVLSDAFPGDLLPIPMTVRLFDWPSDRMKKVRDAAWIGEKGFCAAQGGNRPAFVDLISNDDVIRSFGQMRNTLSRATDTTSDVGEGPDEDDAGGLFQLGEFALDVTTQCLNGADYLSVYAAVEDEFLPTLTKLFRELSETGFGSDASVGRGQFEVVGEPEDASWLNQSEVQCDGLLTLSTFQPGKDDPTEGFWDSFVKYGMLGADFGLENVFKRPLLMLRPGACFLSEQERKFLGRAIPMVELLSNDTIKILNGAGADVAHLAFGLTVPMNLPPELKAEMAKRKEKTVVAAPVETPPEAVSPPPAVEVAPRPKPSPSSSRLKGDDFQHLYSWYLALELLIDPEIAEVRVEDREAGSVDDVTVRRRPGSNKPSQFIQIKYHVDHRESYSSDSFIKRKGKTSLLEKFLASWRLLREQDPDGNIELVFFSNWLWVEGEPVQENLERSGVFKPEFFDAAAGKPLGIIREKWRAHLEIANDDEFRLFMRSLRFRLGVGTETDMWFGGVADRMRRFELKDDEDAFLIAIGLIRERVKNGNGIIDARGLREDIARHKLRLEDSERAISIVIDSTSVSPDELAPDFRLDWREYFLEGDQTTAGKFIRRDEDWNEKLLPSLRTLAKQVRDDEIRNGRIRVIRAYGDNRHAPWFAFGFCFPEVAGYILEFLVKPGQSGEPVLSKKWRTDAPPNPEFQMEIDPACNGTLGDAIDNDGFTVAVGIGISSSIRYSVEGWLKNRPEKVAAALYLQPANGFDSAGLRTAGDVVAMVKQSKLLMQEFVARRHARRLLLFYSGPAVGACFLGHRLNAVAAETIVMNFVQPEYYPSFVLK